MFHCRPTNMYRVLLNHLDSKRQQGVKGTEARRGYSNICDAREEGCQKDFSASAWAAAFEFRAGWYLMSSRRISTAGCTHGQSIKERLRSVYVGCVSSLRRTLANVDMALLPFAKKDNCELGEWRCHKLRKKGPYTGPRKIWLLDVERWALRDVAVISKISTNLTRWALNVEYMNIECWTVPFDWSRHRPLAISENHLGSLSPSFGSGLFPLLVVLGSKIGNITLSNANFWLAPSTFCVGRCNLSAKTLISNIVEFSLSIIYVQS